MKKPKGMSDSIFIAGLALHAYHGVMPHEGKVGQSFKLDILLDIDLTEASRSDRLANTVSYDQVANIASTPNDGTTLWVFAVE